MSQEKIDPALVEVIEKLGDTPIAEKAIYDAIEDKKVKKSAVIKMVLKDTGLDVKNFGAVELGAFYYHIMERITSSKNADGIFKSTPNTENINFPDLDEAEELEELMMRSQEDIPQRTKNEINGRVKERCLEISKIEISKLTEWEKYLVTFQVQDTALGFIKTSLGQDVKN